MATTYPDYAAILDAEKPEDIQRFTLNANNFHEFSEKVCYVSVESIKYYLSGVNGLNCKLYDEAFVKPERIHITHGDIYATIKIRTFSGYDVVRYSPYEGTPIMRDVKISDIWLTPDNFLKSGQYQYKLVGSESLESMVSVMNKMSYLGWEPYGELRGGGRWEYQQMFRKVMT
jgi:hypothetical protein